MASFFTGGAIGLALASSRAIRDAVGVSIIVVGLMTESTGRGDRPYGQRGLCGAGTWHAHRLDRG
jgi:hypothetical protein